MTANELRDLIDTGEGFTLEFKQSVSSSIGREICAFANTQGGIILVGVNDNGIIIGMSKINKAVSEIQMIARNMDPSLLLDFEEIDNVLVVKVPASKKKPHSVGGKFYTREASNSQQLSRDEIKDFFYKEGLIYYDDQLIYQYDIENDLSQRLFSQFKHMCGFSDLLEKERLLENLGLTREGRMTRTGVLLFTENIIPHNISATISCSLFLGHDKVTILDSKHYENDIYTNYQHAITYLLSHINTEFIITKDRRKEIPELPEGVLREALLNAIAHRDYRSSANIQVYIFKDRVEITNPGGLPGGLTKEDFGKVSMPRNPLLFSMLHRMNLVEKIGSGILRMKVMMKEYNLKEPEYEITKNFFTIRFYRKNIDNRGFSGDTDIVGSEKSSEKSSEKTTRTIITLLKSNPDYSAKQLAYIIGISDRAVEKKLAKLKKEGVIKRIGPAKGGYWEVAEP